MLEFGVQLHLPTYRNLSLGALIDVARAATAGGISQVWVTDNLESRNAFVVLAALAAYVPVKLGTAVLVQYFRNPVDVADAVAAITEMMHGRELSLGISRGNPNTPRLMQSVKPVTMLRETAQALGQLLAGESVEFGMYPTLAAYFNLVPERRYRLNFAPQSPVPLYCGGNAPLSLEVGGTYMDGLIYGWTFLAAARAGRLDELLTIADDAARRAGRPALRRVAEIKLYVARDREQARSYCKQAVGSRLLGLRRVGYTTEDFQRLGIVPKDFDRLSEAAATGASGGELAELITDSMVDSLFVAGDPAECRTRLVEVRALAEAHGFEQLMFSELGPDVDEATRMLCDELLPVI